MGIGIQTGGVYVEVVFCLLTLLAGYLDNSNYAVKMQLYAYLVLYIPHVLSRTGCNEEVAGKQSIVRNSMHLPEKLLFLQ